MQRKIVKTQFEVFSELNTRKLIFVFYVLVHKCQDPREISYFVDYNKAFDNVRLVTDHAVPTANINHCTILA